ncbi:UBIQUITIN_CONJUGAT_2 domain-containing protein [Meloidogyne graminicola]|uniref:UBIQUITIN_CONJUGAT_2 domain-containing protein n=1 Tax=Meloidogyne graminicola TaxID=189291 RepID=A0A8S9ZVD7_9BILA|nr:UBIQUITIN_CONJUGAT_2 domain-containing protein [Meloidogyne graminicola]
MNLNNICLPSSSDVQAVGLPRKQSTTYHENVKSFLNSNQTSFVNLPSSIASHRLFEELYNLKNFSLPGCHTFPSSEDIFKWSVVLEGPTDTVYSNGIFLLN